MQRTLSILFITLSTGILAQGRFTKDEIFDEYTLPEYCDSFPTDKCNGKHGFVEIYEERFAPLRKQPIRFFEIGILNGVSHLMWRTYFRNAEIFGIDLRDYSDKSKGSGIMTFVADQANREDLQRFIEASGGKFDVILDDGGHAMDHQQISLGYLFPHVNSGGMFIIEDVHTSLPDYYSREDFNVNESESNTTLLMIEYFIRTGKIRSEFMTEKEAAYLTENIERIELHYMHNDKHSIMCIIHKK